MLQQEYDTSLVYLGSHVSIEVIDRYLQTWSRTRLVSTAIREAVQRNLSSLCILDENDTRPGKESERARDIFHKVMNNRAFAKRTTCFYTEHISTGRVPVMKLKDTCMQHYASDNLQFIKCVGSISN